MEILIYFILSDSVGNRTHVLQISCFILQYIFKNADYVIDSTLNMTRLFENIVIRMSDIVIIF